jgi:hypothetical protein
MTQIQSQSPFEQLQSSAPMARSPRLCPQSFVVCYSSWVSPRPQSTRSRVFPGQGTWSSLAQWRSSMGRRWSVSMLVPPVVWLVVWLWPTLLGRQRLVTQHESLTRPEWPSTCCSEGDPLPLHPTGRHGGHPVCSLEDAGWSGQWLLLFRPGHLAHNVVRTWHWWGATSRQLPLVRLTREDGTTMEFVTAISSNQINVLNQVKGTSLNEIRIVWDYLDVLQRICQICHPTEISSSSLSC